MGSVPYLNAVPLTSFIPGTVEWAVPSQLARRYKSGALDAALLPIYQLLQDSAPLIADGISISSHGEVFSVFLAHREPLSEVKQVYLDPASLTSNALFRCLCAEFLDWAPEISTESPGPTDARVLIGDLAIDFRIAQPEGWHFLDFGQAWTLHTGLPFVYAAWGLQGKFAPEIAKHLRTAKQMGMANLSDLVAKDRRPDFARAYLGGYIRYDLNKAEKEAIALFSKLLHKYGLSPVISQPRFI